MKGTTEIDGPVLSVLWECSFACMRLEYGVWILDIDANWYVNAVKVHYINRAKLTVLFTVHHYYVCSTSMLNCD